MNQREAPKILTARPAIGLLGYSAIIWEGARISQRKEKLEKEKTSYEENPGYPFSEKLPNM